MIARGTGYGKGLVREFGTDMYTLLLFKMDNQQGPTIYSTRNSAQCYLTIWMGEAFGRE